MKMIILSVIISFGFLPTAADNNFDWLTEYYWIIGDGSVIAGISTEAVPDRNENFEARFRRLELPPGSVLLQERLRRERFMLLYQVGEKIDTLHIVENAFFSNGVYSLEWRNNYNRIIWRRNGILRGGQNRIGEQINSSFPIVGAWGELPFLTEYRIVNPRGIIYYLEIERFPDSAIRGGTYLLKQVGENVFETVSSFPDGRLRLEILREGYVWREGRYVLRPITENRTVLVTPLFSGEEEEELMTPLVLRRWSRIQDYE